VAAHPAARKVDDAREWWAWKMIVAMEGWLRLLVTSTMRDDDDGEHVMKVWEMASYADERWEKKVVVSLNHLHA
jgi:hypothetical protein